MSKIEAGQVTLQEHSSDLTHLLDDLKEMFHLQASDRGLELVFDLTPDLPRHVYLDENKLRQVLINLLNNAVKFTREGNITLRVAYQAAPHPEGVPPGSIETGTMPGEAGGKSSRMVHTLHFSVEDTGCGIAPVDLHSLFDPFVQTASGGEISRRDRPGPVD